eukprot:3591351-Pyramimonas_sp.AAC.1
MRRPGPSWMVVCSFTRARPTAAACAVQLRLGCGAVGEALAPSGFSQNRGERVVAPCPRSARQNNFGLSKLESGEPFAR